MIRKFKKREKNQERLKKLSDKKVYTPKKINQKSANLIFGSLLIGFVVFVGVAGVLSIKNVSKVKEFEKNQIAKVDNKEIDRRLEQFLDSYVSYYFTYKAGEKDSEENAKRLSEFYGTPPSVKNQGQSKQDMSIVSGRLLMAKDGVAVYAVTYDTKVDNKVQRVSIEFSIPYVEKDGRYYVDGLPWFAPVTDFKSQEIDKEKQLILTANDGLSENDRKDLVAFIELFFKNYTSSQSNLDLISKNIKTIGGATVKSIDYTYFVKGSDKTLAYVQVTFDVLGTSHSENFSFELRKDKDSYFVDKMEHQIPFDYAKKDKKEN